MTRKRDLSTPFADQMPPLLEDEFAALEASIKANGVRDDVLIDEDDNVLDGHHRLKIDPNAPRKVVKGLGSEAEKRAFIYQINNARRSLTPQQKKRLATEQRKVALALREQDPKKFTQKTVAGMIGVSQATISGWFRVKGSTNINTDNGIPPSPDARRKVPEADRSTVADRVKKGESKKKIATSLGVTPRAVTKIAESVNRKTSGNGSAGDPNAVTGEAQQSNSRPQRVEESTATPTAPKHGNETEQSPATPFDQVIIHIESVLEHLKMCNELTQKIEELVSGAIDVESNVNSANNLTIRFTKALKTLKTKAAEFRVQPVDDEHDQAVGEQGQNDGESADDLDLGRPSRRVPGRNG